MIRGGLVGTDPNNVAAAASVASNMLKQNPNAFAGVEGGEDIGKAAAAYTHYVDDLGMSSQEAANKIALMNSPEYQAKTKANEPERNAFITSITGASKNGKVSGGIDIEKILGESLGLSSTGRSLASLGTRALSMTGGAASLIGLTGTGDATVRSFGPAQKAEAEQTYLELALDYYDKHPGDPAAAQAYATRQMSRFYGVDAGRLVKYPSSKAYPEIMGSREYIYDQATELVNQFTGLKVPKEDIVLQPTASGSSAAAFRQGQPVPYEVHYVTHENGQTIYHFIPGKVFVADVDRARRDAAVKARQVEQGIRASDRASRSSQVGLTLSGVPH
jgi:hypothetical protein